MLSTMYYLSCTIYMLYGTIKIFGDTMIKKAFTLAETLITLGIVGIIAVVTIPSLIAKYNEKTTVTKLQNVYSLLQQATQKMIQDEGVTIDNFGTNDDERKKKYTELLPKYVQIAKTCKGLTNGCIAYKYTSGVVGATSDKFAGTSPLTNSYLLKNGAAIRISSGGTCQQDTTLKQKGCSEYNISNCEPNQAKHYYGTYQHACFELLVDINGSASPNKTDVDAFGFAVVKDGIVPLGSSKETIHTQLFEDSCVKFKKNANGRCAAWVIYNKNMDYLHCPEKLGWNKASSCKD